MQWWQTVLAAIGGTTIAVGMVIGAVKWVINQIADGLQKKYDEHLQEKFELFKKDINKELEKHRSVLNNKNYITQKKFDAEFEMYQTLAEKNYKLVKAASTLIPSGFVHVPADKEARKKIDEKHFEDLMNAMREAQDVIYKYGPFIQQEVFEEYQEILKLCQGHKFVYESRWDANDHRTQEEKETFGISDYKRTEKILTLYDDVNHKLRDYLRSLEIL